MLFNKESKQFCYFLGAFEVAILRMVRYYSVERKVVLFFDTVLPMEAFMNTGNSMEMKFVSQVEPKTV